MPLTFSRKQKPRSSKRFCQEKLCCKAEYSEASLFCSECDTLQCVECEKYIHNNCTDNKYIFHDRNTLEEPTGLCQVTLLNAKRKFNVYECHDKNYADVRCYDCVLNLCLFCNNIVHAGKRKSHKVVLLKDIKKVNLPVSNSDSIEETNDTDSLPFVSLPLYSSTESVNDMSFARSKNIRNVGSIVQDPGNEIVESDPYEHCHSICLADENETLKVLDEEDFINKLGCDRDHRLKVVSIFGNTGDGKSHTLNFTFFAGKEVFETSAYQDSCTVGVSMAFDHLNHALIIDTEGLLGIASNENQRTRLLLKVMAISDIVIYRTRAQRLHNDLFSFLGNASKSYIEHFKKELEAATERMNMTLSISNLGPAVIIFHETQHTDVLTNDPERTIRQRFHDLGCSIEAFSDLIYIGTRTEQPPTDFNPLYNCATTLLKNNSIRTPRSPTVIYNALKVLNTKFSGSIDRPKPDSFPDQYFTCTATCYACSERCSNSINHSDDHKIEPSVICKYQHQYGNKIFLCKVCYLSGKRNIIVPKTSASSDSSWVGFAKYLWSGYVLECASCGIVYRSHQYWYGNQDVDSVVQVEVCHVWSNTVVSFEGSHNAARKVLDGLSTLADTVSTVSAKPTKIISDWMADQIAPSYWVPNYQILACFDCGVTFTHADQKHHCRSCGQGFCEACSAYERPVPERGWGEFSVRVCSKCYGVPDLPDGGGITTGNADGAVTARKLGESVTNTLGAIASVIDYPLGVLKDTARPGYWIPDDKITQCYLCCETFTAKLPIHHCRNCGQGVCATCSPSRQPVPLRGWDYPVRVCKKCEQNSDNT